jgi:hypothetical protein
MYSIIPITETKHILCNILKNSVIDPDTTHELRNWYDVITMQNYFSYNNQILLQKDGLAMGAPFSGIVSETFLQYFEHTHIPHLTGKHKRINYFRYVDDILIIFDTDHTNIQSILTNFNTLHPNMKFTTQLEQNNTINFLDTTIHKTHDNIEISIYRKPTFTDTTIHKTHDNIEISIYRKPTFTDTTIHKTHDNIR